jgi:hypothetical protein
MKRQENLLLKKNKNDPLELVNIKFLKKLVLFLIDFFVEECAPNGTYISLINSSKNKIPDGIQLQPNRELRIYTKLNENLTTSETTSYRKLINTEINSWGNN